MLNSFSICTRCTTFGSRNLDFICIDCEVCCISSSFCWYKCIFSTCTFYNSITLCPAYEVITIACCCCKSNLLAISNLFLSSCSIANVCRAICSVDRNANIVGYLLKVGSIVDVACYSKFIVCNFAYLCFTIIPTNEFITCVWCSC